MTVPAQKGAGWVLLASLLRPQGKKGEVLAECFTDFPESLNGRAGLFLAPPEFSGEASEARVCSVTDVWLPKGKNEGRIVLAIGAITSIDAAEALSGLELIVRSEDRQPLTEDATYISDIVGSTLLDGGKVIGVVQDIQFPTTPDGRRRLEDAAPLLVVSSGDDELLVPFVRQHMDRIDGPARELHMHLPAGLIDLQREASADTVDEQQPLVPPRLLASDQGPGQ